MRASLRNGERLTNQHPNDLCSHELVIGWTMGLVVLIPAFNATNLPSVQWHLGQDRPGIPSTELPKNSIVLYTSAARDLFGHLFQNSEIHGKWMVS